MKFWMIKKEDGGPATVRQESLQSAIGEAKRLYVQSPGCYYILEAVGYVGTIKVPPKEPKYVNLASADLTPEEKVLALSKQTLIEAVKCYRDRTGNGLRVSKDAIDSFRLSVKENLKEWI